MPRLEKLSGSELVSYVPLSGAIAVILQEEMEDREFLEFAIENYTQILDTISTKPDGFAIRKDGECGFCFEVNGDRVDVPGVLGGLFLINLAIYFLNMYSIVNHQPGNRF